MKILIVEDEIIIAAELSDLLTEMGYTVCGMAVNYSNAIALLQAETPDVALVDINIGGSNTGIDVGEYINQNNKIPFIYLTSFTDKTTIDSALVTKPSAYLTKPFSKSLIYSALELALSTYSSAQLSNKKIDDIIINNALFVKEKDTYVKVAIDDILYFKSDKNYIEAFTAKKRYLIRSTFGNLLDGKLGTQFFRVHKSYAVNISKIEGINHSHIKVSNNDSVPLSDSYRTELLEKIQKFN